MHIFDSKFISKTFHFAKVSLGNTRQIQKQIIRKARVETCRWKYHKENSEKFAASHPRTRPRQAREDRECRGRKKTLRKGLRRNDLHQMVHCVSGLYWVPTEQLKSRANSGRFWKTLRTQDSPEVCGTLVLYLDASSLYKEHCTFAAEIQNICLEFRCCSNTRKKNH